MAADRLEAILRTTRERVAALRSRTRELERQAASAPAPRPFERATSGPDIGVIAEVKRRSPSAGAIRQDLDPVQHARAYAQCGAVATPVLTDEAHFGVSLEDLARSASAVA